MALAENLKKYREKVGLTQAELAEKIGVTQCYLSQVERGSKILTLPTAQAIASTLNVTIDELVN